jgi:hypothetical protein
VLPPQHSTPPPAVTAQAKLSTADTDTAVTPLVSPETCTGMELFVVELFPSRPWPFAPQQFTPPPAVTAQSNWTPTDTAVAVV